MSDSDDAFPDSDHSGTTSTTAESIELGDPHLEQQDEVPPELEVTSDVTSKLRDLMNKTYSPTYCKIEFTLWPYIVNVLPLLFAILTGMSTMKVPITACYLPNGNKTDVNNCYLCNDGDFPEAAFITAPTQNSTFISGSLAIVMVEFTMGRFLSKCYWAAMVFTEGILISPAPNQGWDSWIMIGLTLLSLGYFAWHRVADETALEKPITGCIYEGTSEWIILTAKSDSQDIPQDAEWGMKLHDWPYFETLVHTGQAIIFCFAYKEYLTYMYSYYSHSLPGIGLEKVIETRGFGASLDKHVTHQMTWAQCNEIWDQMKKEKLIKDVPKGKKRYETAEWPEFVRRLRDPKFLRKELEDDSS